MGSQRARGTGLAAEAWLVAAFAEAEFAKDLVTVGPAIRVLRRVLSALDRASRAATAEQERCIPRARTPERDRVVATLTLRERQVLEGLKTGLCEKEVAARLKLSVHTVHYYAKSLHRKLEVSSRSELLALWIANEAEGRTRSR